MLANFVITEQEPDGVERIIYGPELKQTDHYGGRDIGRVIVAEAVGKGAIANYDPAKHEVCFVPYQRLGRE